MTAPTPPPAGDSTPGPRKPRTGGPRKDKGGKPGSPSRAQRKAERAAEALAVAAAAEKAKRPPREKPVAAPPRPLVPPREDGLPWVIAVFGPTASGKTALAEAIADSVDGEVVSCDSMQCYAGLPILTNQPERETRLVGIWPLTHSGSVGEYQALAHAAIDEIVSSGQVAVVTGGTGLYLRAALAELHLPPAPRPGLRQEMEALHARLGAVEAHRELARRDPEAAAALHPNDTRRVIRALELHSVGKTLTPDRDRLWSKTTRLSSLIVGLDVERDLLARRIAERTAAMWERGGPDEARAALTVDGLSDQARQLIGLRETELGLERDEWIESVEARTRQYARRQRTWMRKIPGMQPLDGSRPAAYLAAELLVGLRAG